MRYPLTPERMASSKRLKIINVGEDAEKRESLLTDGGNVS
jgi:hypothetical protein